MLVQCVCFGEVTPDFDRPRCICRGSNRGAATIDFEHVKMNGCGRIRNGVATIDFDPPFSRATTLVNKEGNSEGYCVFRKCPLASFVDIFASFFLLFIFTTLHYHQTTKITIQNSTDITYLTNKPLY